MNVNETKSALAFLRKQATATQENPEDVRSNDIDKQLENFMIKATAMLALAISTGNNQAYVEVCNAAKNCIAKLVGREQAEYFVKKVLVPIAYDMKDDVCKVYDESIKQ